MPQDRLEEQNLDCVGLMHRGGSRLHPLLTLTISSSPLFASLHSLHPPRAASQRAHRSCAQPAGHPCSSASAKRSRPGDGHQRVQELNNTSWLPQQANCTVLLIQQHPPTSLQVVNRWAMEPFLLTLHTCLPSSFITRQGCQLNLVYCQWCVHGFGQHLDDHGQGLIGDGNNSAEM
eukprot:1161617-Pelagomonas_calceolata.AAC.2